MNAPVTISILGSTGHVGTQQVQSIASEPETRVVALAAGGESLELLAYQAVTLGVYGLAVRHGEFAQVHAALEEANRRTGANVRPEVLIGTEGLAQAASGAQEVINAIDGVEGVHASFAALEKGRRLGVANTDTLLTLDLLAEELPNLDVAQQIHLLNPALNGIKESLQEVQATRVLLATPRQQPLGRRRDRTTINGYTGMGAGLTLLELAALTPVEIDVVIHDGPVAALLELGDGRTLVTARQGQTLHGEPPADWQFELSDSPAVELARGAAHEGRTYPLALHFANTHAVRAHLEGRLEVDEILGVLARVLDGHDPDGFSMTGLSRLDAEVARRVDDLLRTRA